jgi:hypothetical protein
VVTRIPLPYLNRQDWTGQVGDLHPPPAVSDRPSQLESRIENPMITWCGQPGTHDAVPSGVPGSRIHCPSPVKSIRAAAARNWPGSSRIVLWPGLRFRDSPTNWMRGLRLPNPSSDASNATGQHMMPGPAKATCGRRCTQQLDRKIPLGFFRDGGGESILAGSCLEQSKPFLGTCRVCSFGSALSHRCLPQFLAVSLNRFAICIVLVQSDTLICILERKFYRVSARPRAPTGRCRNLRFGGRGGEA